MTTNDMPTGLQELAAWLDIAKNIGVIGILVFFLYGGSGKRRWWVYGWVYEAEVQRSNEYKNLVFHLSGLAKTSVEMARESTMPTWRQQP